MSWSCLVPGAPETAGKGGFSRAEVAAILAPFYARGERIVLGVLLVHLGVALALAPFADTWWVAVPAGLVAVGLFALSIALAPRTSFTRCVAGVALQVFVALHLYQLAGLPEARVFFFTACTFLVMGYDWKAMWPGALLIVGSLVAFAVLNNAGGPVPFLPELRVGVATLAFHLGVALVYVALCSGWAYYLRRQVLHDAEQRREIAWLALVARKTQNAVVLTNVQGWATWVNEGFTHLTGWALAEVVGHDPAALMNGPATDPQAVERQRQAVASRQPFEGELIQHDRDGRPFWVTRTVTPLHDPSIGLASLVAIDADITAQKKAEEALRASEAQLRSVTDSLPGVVFQLPAGRDGAVTFPLLSRRAGEILGVAAEGAQRDAGLLLNRIDPDDLRGVRANLEESARTLEPWSQQYRYHLPDDAVRWAWVHSVPARQPDGGVVWNGVLLDVTERVQAERAREALEQKLQETAKLESLGVLAGVIAHDFNNLLTAVRGYTELARQVLPEQSPAQLSLDQVEQATVRAAELCQLILAYAGRGRFVVGPLDLGAVVRDTASLFRVSISKKAILKLDLADDLPAVVGDATQLRQVIMNLVVNASEALAEREGTIRLATGIEFPDPARGKAGCPGAPPAGGPYVWLEVSDTGAGMDAGTLARIFDPFFTTKFTGRGLGLSAAQGIVRSHDGVLRVQSEPGRGTSFRLLLPAAPAPAPPGPRQADEPEWQGTGTVLVADDEDGVRGLAAHILESLGFTVVQARDGRDALEQLARHETVRLMLLDLTMPRLDGAQVLEELRRERPAFPVILMSGYSESELDRRFPGQKVAGFLQKPFRRAELAGKVRRALAGGAGGAGTEGEG